MGGCGGTVQPKVFCGKLSACKTRDFINIYWEENERMGWFFRILRTTPKIPRRKREPVPIPVPVQQRQPSKRRKIPPYAFNLPEYPKRGKESGKKLKENEPKPSDFCVRTY